MSSKRISFNILFNYFGIFGQIIIAFFLTPFLVNTLGDTKYGIWSIAAAFTGYMSLLDLGLSSAVNRYVSKYSGKNDIDSINTIVSSALALFIFMSFIVVSLSPLMASMIVKFININEELTNLVYLLIIIVSFDVGIFVIGNLFRGLFGGLQRYDIINMVQILSALYKAVMFYIFLSRGHDLIAMGYISLSANITSILLFFIFVKNKYPFVKINLLSIKKNRLQQILSFSKYSFLAMLANQIIYYSDAFVIGYFLTASAVTFYSIPWSLSEYTKKMCQAVSRTYTPAFSEKESTENIESIRDLYISGTRVMIIVSNLLSIGIIFFGGSLIAIWIGPKYRELCETVLIILFINQFIMGPQLISYSLLQGLSLQKVYSYATILVSFVNLSLSIIFIQYWGIVGVAIGAAIPQVIFHGLFVPLHTTKKIGLNVSEYFNKTYLSSIIPTLILGISLFLCSQYFIIDSYPILFTFAFLAAIIYMVFTYFFMLNTDEKMFILEYMQKFRYRNSKF